MNEQNNIMVLNGQNIGISKIELDKSDLLITDKSGKYCVQVKVEYNWKEINSLKIGEKKSVDFNEYFLHENNEPALIWPSNCLVEKIESTKLCFYLKFENLPDTVHYMNKRGCFDIELDSLEIRVFIDYKDAQGNSIIYEF